MRKQINKRGKNPRSTYIQLIPEAQFLKGTYEEEGETKEITIPNPEFGKFRRVKHKVSAS